MEFCKLAIVETKERASQLIEHLERRVGDMDGSIRINLNGCPNACAQYQIADIGLQGGIARMPDGSACRASSCTSAGGSARARLRPAGRLEGDPGR